MFHCKVLVVDGVWTSVGSTNFDNRSFRLNDEANLNIYDAEFARHQIAIFNADLARSRRVGRLVKVDTPRPFRRPPSRHRRPEHHTAPAHS